MLLKDLENKILKKYNLSTSCINRPIHYKIPDSYTSKNTKTSNIKTKFSLNLKQKILLSCKKDQKISYSQDNETRRREKNTLLQKQKLQRVKLDLLINTTLDKINSKIRMRNSFYPNNSGEKLGYLSKYSKVKIRDNLIEKSHLMYPDLKTVEDEKLNNQYEWSKNFLEQLKMQEYRKLYSIRHIKFNYSASNKLKNKNNQNENSVLNIPNINLAKPSPIIKSKKSDKVVVRFNSLKKDDASPDSNIFYNTHSENFSPIKPLKHKKLW